MITDFSVFPTGVTEGKAPGGFWYHEGTQSYFDDVDQYRMIKATCRLSCSVCDKNTEEPGARRPYSFRDIDQLRAHLFHQHKLLMCNLCLKGRKVFICEQKLYTKAQLDQHKSTGDSEVDGTESERGGFMGHPFCEFCRNPFYGDNELFMHMSTEHFKCFICEKQHPGQYDYFRNYNDLESHFRQEHFLCENENCLEEKFIVFQTEAEMKRHNTLKHAGNMSRSQRNAALQIPTSFTYRRNEQEQRRRRERGHRNDHHIEFNYEHGDARPIPGEVNQSEVPSLEPLNINPDAEPLRSVLQAQSSRNTPIIEESSFPPLSDREPSESSSRYAQILNSSRNPSRLGEESFPPLPGVEKGSKPEASHKSETLRNSRLAAHIRNKRPVVTNSSAWSRPTGSSVSASSQHKPAINPGNSSTSAVSHRRAGANHGSPSISAANPGISSSTSAVSHPRAGTNHGSASSNAINSGASSSSSAVSHPWAGANHGAPSSSATQVKSIRENELTPPILANSSWNPDAVNKLKHSASAPVLVGGSTGAGNQAFPTISQTMPVAKEVRTANKSLVERILAGLEMNEDKYSAFKNISLEYRQDQINTWEYLSYVEQFGLSHLVPELAENCPDPRKRKELMDAYNANFRGKVLQEIGDNVAATSKEGKKGKGKGKAIDCGNSSSTTDALTDSILDTVRRLQSNMKPQEEVETLSKDGYRSANSKQHPTAKKPVVTNLSGSNGINSKQNTGGVGNKQKKTSKFHRVRLGDGSAAALLNPDQSDASPERPSSEHQEGTVPVRGVWKNGGGLKIVKSSK